MSSSLPTVAFGRTDMRVSRVGFGAWAIGGVGWPDAWARRTTRSRSPRSTARSSAA